jgi:hypothetical protein
LKKLAKSKNIATKRIRIKFNKRKTYDEIVKKSILKIFPNKKNSN